MEPNAGQNAEKEYSTLECMKGLFLCAYRFFFYDVVNCVINWYWSCAVQFWRFMFTRMDLYLEEINDPEKLKDATDAYGYWYLFGECIVPAVIFGCSFRARYGVAWLFIYMLCRILQGVYYEKKKVSTAAFYTLPGALYNTRQIFADNWNWLKKIGADELKRRAAEKTSTPTAIL